MALTISIRINGRDARATYGLEILSNPIHDMPDMEGEDFAAIGRDGSIPGAYQHKKRDLKLSGYISQASHSALLTALDALKSAMGAEYHGARTFRIEFTNLSDRYYMARLTTLRVMLVGPHYIATAAQVELTLSVDQPLGVYDTLTLANVTGSPFSSPFSMAYTHSGTAISRPRITVENVGAGNITSLEILNTACESRTRTVTATATGSITRNTGRWTDQNGAAQYLTALAPTLKFTTKGNFNPAAFTILGFFRRLTGGGITAAYMFSTTSGTIQLYYDVTNSKWVFSVNGTAIEIADSASGFTTNEWWMVAASYSGGATNLSLYDIDGATLWIAAPGSVSYSGIPTEIFIGTDATPANAGNKQLDDIRLFNYVLNGMGANPATNSELESYYLATGPLPMSRGCTLYLPFDYKLDGIACENTSLIITDTMAQYELYEIDCERMQVYALAAGLAASPSTIMNLVSGVFPFLVPGTNGIQVIHNGSASALNLAIEEKRRFL